MKWFTPFFLVFLIGCGPKQESSLSPGKPNILIIVADDLGFSDIQPYGSNIPTPVLSQFAKESTLFSNFHVLPTCSPTRSALLTGNDNHVAGLGIMHEMDYPVLQHMALPGYSGNLSQQVATIPELLRENNYHTYMVGKWHLGEGAGHDPFDRGFEESFILGTGGGSNYDDLKALAPLQHMEYTRNGKVTSLPADFYSTRNYTDSLIRFMDRNKKDNRPFFAFLSYTAVHDPLQAPREYVEKYKGQFDQGWDSVRLGRLKNLKSLGIVPADVKSLKNPSIPAWASLTAAQKKEYASDMEVYAGMLDYMDMSIGRVFDYLKESGTYDNTLVIFMSDNGANGAIASTYPGNEDGKYMASFNNSDENKGLKDSYVEAGPGWAQASSAPFRYFKSFATEGGIKAPLIIKMPGSQARGNWSHSLIHVTDIMPTILDLTKTTYPELYKGNSIHPLIGKSITPILNGTSTDVRAGEGIGYELFEMKAYIKDNWKILRLPFPMGSGEWELYDIGQDPGETTDLSSAFPDKKAVLIQGWNEYAKANGVHDHRGHYDSLYRRSF